MPEHTILCFRSLCYRLSQGQKYFEKCSHRKKLKSVVNDFLFTYIIYTQGIIQLKVITLNYLLTIKHI